MPSNAISYKGRLNNIFQLGVNPSSLPLSKTGPLVSKLLVWPEGDGFGVFLGLHLAQLPPFPSNHNSGMAPCKPTTPITTRQEPFLPPVVKGGKHNLYLTTFMMSVKVFFL